MVSCPSIALPNVCSTFYCDTIVGCKAIQSFKAKSPLLISTTSKAELMFDVPRAQQFLQHYMPHCRISIFASIYLAGSLEYIAGEVLELAGHAATDLNSKTINTRHIFLAVRGDEELDTLFAADVAMLHNTGVIPHIHRLVTIVQ